MNEKTKFFVLISILILSLALLFYAKTEVGNNFINQL